MRYAFGAIVVVLACSVSFSVRASDPTYDGCAAVKGISLQSKKKFVRVTLKLHRHNVSCTSIRLVLPASARLKKRRSTLKGRGFTAFTIPLTRKSEYSAHAVFYLRKHRGWKAVHRQILRRRARIRTVNLAYQVFIESKRIQRYRSRQARRRAILAAFKAYLFIEEAVAGVNSLSLRGNRRSKKTGVFGFVSPRRMRFALRLLRGRFI